jgi:hypothetical protein
MPVLDVEIDPRTRESLVSNLKQPARVSQITLELDAQSRAPAIEDTQSRDFLHLKAMQDLIDLYAANNEPSLHTPRPLDLTYHEWLTDSALSTLNDSQVLFKYLTERDKNSAKKSNDAPVKGAKVRQDGRQATEGAAKSAPRGRDNVRASSLATATNEEDLEDFGPTVERTLEARKQILVVPQLWILKIDDCTLHVLFSPTAHETVN